MNLSRSGIPVQEMGLDWGGLHVDISGGFGLTTGADIVSGFVSARAYPDKLSRGEAGEGRLPVAEET